MFFPPFLFSPLKLFFTVPVAVGGERATAFTKQSHSFLYSQNHYKEQIMEAISPGRLSPVGHSRDSIDSYDRWVGKGCAAFRKE